MLLLLNRGIPNALAHLASVSGLTSRRSHSPVVWGYRHLPMAFPFCICRCHFVWHLPGSTPFASSISLLTFAPCTLGVGKRTANRLLLYFYDAFSRLSKDLNALVIAHRLGKVYADMEERELRWLVLWQVTSLDHRIPTRESRAWPSVQKRRFNRIESLQLQFQPRDKAHPKDCEECRPGCSQLPAELSVLFQT